MSEPFLGQLRIFGFTFAPRGHALCDGQILPINQNQSLYSLLGTTYGGDGRTTFGLPDLRGRTPIHKGQNGAGGGHSLGQKTGVETVTLSVAQIPSHTHAFNVVSADATEQRANEDGTSRLAKANVDMYRSGAGNVNVPGVSSVGGGQSHTNLQPTLVINYCIALQGIFPSRN